MELTQIFERSKIIPVLTIDKIETAIPLANALLAGGISVMEITLRTEIAYDAIKQIISHVPDMLVAATTVLHVEQLSDVAKLGVQYASTPGFSPMLAQQAQQVDLPYLPSVSTVSEVMIAKDMKLETLKFFPAEFSGGPKFLSLMALIFPDIKFCASGSIHYNNFSDYLSLNNVISIAGTWMTEKSMISNENWGVITELAKQAVKYQRTISPT